MNEYNAAKTNIVVRTPTYKIMEMVCNKIIKQGGNCPLPPDSIWSQYGTHAPMGISTHYNKGAVGWEYMNYYDGHKADFPIIIDAQEFLNDEITVCDE